MDQKTGVNSNCKLYIRFHVPLEVTAEELKSLSPDILNVKLPASRVRKKNKKCFAFLEFASEDKAEENYILLQDKKVAGIGMNVDFVGDKCRNSPQIYGPRSNQLSISGVKPDRSTYAHLEKVFPTAVSIVFRNSAMCREAIATYRTVEEAAKELRANTKLKINGRDLSIKFHYRNKEERKNPDLQRRENSPQSEAKTSITTADSKVRATGAEKDQGAKDPRKALERIRTEAKPCNGSTRDRDKHGPAYQSRGHHNADGPVAKKFRQAPYYQKR